MRVFYCNNIFDQPQTGGELFYARILSDLKSRRHVELILPTETDLRILNRVEGCLGINWYFFNRFRCLPKGTIIVESERDYYDFFLANWFARRMRSDIGILVSTLQVPAPLQSGRRDRLIRDSILCLLFHSADTIAVNSSYLGRELTSRYGVQQDRIHIVYSAAQELTLPTRQSAVRQDDGALRLLCVAHIRPLKGQQVLVEALSHLRDYRLELMLVGGTKDEGYEHVLRTLITKLGLAEHVRMTGRLEGQYLAKAYAEADICVIPSLYEAYGMVAQEAMSFSLPVVASDVGGIPEQVRDGVDGFLVTPGDPTALAKALHRLIEDPELRARMGKQGRQRAAELPTWAQVSERFYQALATVGE